jgi:hypothetical protein
MAERGFTPIKVHPLFSNKSLSAGDTGTSGAVDLRYEAQRGKFALQVTVEAGTAGTAGTTVFTYQLATSLGGVYTAPAGATAIGTFGTGGLSDFKAFEPILGPFMKIVATQAGADTAGFDSKITSAALICQ